MHTFKNPSPPSETHRITDRHPGNWLGNHIWYPPPRLTLKHVHSPWQIQSLTRRQTKLCSELLHRLRLCSSAPPRSTDLECRFDPDPDHGLQFHQLQIIGRGIETLPMMAMNLSHCRKKSTFLTFRMQKTRPPSKRNGEIKLIQIFMAKRSETKERTQQTFRKLLEKQRKYSR